MIRIVLGVKRKLDLLGPYEIHLIISQIPFNFFLIFNGHIKYY